MNNFMSTCEDASKFIDKNSPAILTGLGIAGMFFTMIFVDRAARKSKQILDEARIEVEVSGDEVKKEVYTEAVKEIAPSYIPVILAAAGSTVCLIKSCTISSKRVAALTTSCAVLDTAFKNYRNKVVETIGERKEEKIRDSINKEELEKTKVPEGIVCLDGEVLFYDKYRDGYFSARPDDVLNGVAEVNNTIYNNGMGYASIRDLYLEIDPRLASKASTVEGWNSSNPLLVRFTYGVAPNMSTCWFIDYINPPIVNYDKWR